MHLFHKWGTWQKIVVESRGQKYNVQERRCKTCGFFQRERLVSS